MSIAKRVNRFSKEYFLYPEETAKAEAEFAEEASRVRAEKAAASRSKAARVAALEQKNGEEVERVLREKFVALADLPRHADWMPLEKFDDEVFELYSSADWQAMFEGEDGKRIPMRATVFVENSPGQQSWARAQVMEVEGPVWRVKLEGSGETLTLPRVKVALDVEDKFNFAARFSAAIFARISADAQQRRKFFVDALPRSAVRPMPVQKKSAIFHRVFSGKVEEDKQFVEEIADDFYARELNRLVFDLEIERQPEFYASRHQLLPIPPPPAEHRPLGIIQGPRRLIAQNTPSVYRPASLSVTETFKLFCLNSLYSRPSFISAITQIRTRLGSLTGPLAAMPIGALPLEMFKAALDEDLASHLSNLRNLVRRDLVAIAKAAISSDENPKENKPRNLFQLVDVLLSDRLNELLASAVSRAERFIAGPEQTKIFSASRVESKFTDPRPFVVTEQNYLQSNNPRPPVFSVSVRFSENRCEFTTSTDKFFDHVISYLERLAVEYSKLEGVAELAIHGPKLKAPTLKNTTVSSLRTAASLTQKPLQEFLLALNPAAEFFGALPSSFAPDNLTPVQLCAFGAEKRAAYVALSSEIREELQLSLFKIDCREPLAKLKSVINDLDSRISRNLEERGRNVALAALSEQKTAKAIMRDKPTNVVPLRKLYDYINGELNEVIDSMKARGESLKEIYGCLDDRRVRISTEDLKKFWNVLGGPRVIVESRNSVSNELMAQKSQFYKELTNQQLQFDVEIEKLEKELKNFFGKVLLETHALMFSEAEELSATFEQKKLKAEEFNNQEALFGRKPTDYSKIGQLEKSFRPVAELWRVANHWLAKKPTWIVMGWTAIDIQAVIDFIDDSLKGLPQIATHLRDKTKKEFVPLLKNVEKIRKEIEEFHPKIKIIELIRSPGMKEHYLQTLMAQTQVELSDSMTCSQVIQAFEAHFPLLEKIAGEAQKELEMSIFLDDVNSSWESLSPKLIPSEIRDGYKVVENLHDLITKLNLDRKVIDGNIEQFAFILEKRKKISELLTQIGNLLSSWTILNNTFLTLKAAFDTAEIAKELPVEGSRLRKIDHFYKNSINIATSLPTLVEILADKIFLNNILEFGKELVAIQNEVELIQAKKETLSPTNAEASTNLKQEIQSDVQPEATTEAKVEKPVEEKTPKQPEPSQVQDKSEKENRPVEVQTPKVQIEKSVKEVSESQLEKSVKEASESQLEDQEENLIDNEEDDQVDVEDSDKSPIESLENDSN